jgi:hypothetical protein
MKGNEMKQDICNKNYILSWDLDHLIDLDNDAWLVKFPGYENIGLCLLREYNLPERIEFDAVFDAIQSSDYPINNIDWNIMSQKMLNTLLSVGDFQYKAIPIVMVDCEVVMVDDEAIGRSNRSEKEDHRFIAVQLLEHLDIFDWENSVYEPDPTITDLVDSIDKLVLKQPQDGFPPIFRLSVYPYVLFVSGKARMALEQVGIRGVVFEEIENYDLTI